MKYEKNKKFQHLENFLSMKIFDFLLTFSNSWFFYDHDGSFEVFWCWKRFCLEKVDQKSKFDFLVQMKFYQMFQKLTDEVCELLGCFESRNLVKMLYLRYNDQSLSKKVIHCSKNQRILPLDQNPNWSILDWSMRKVGYLRIKGWCFDQDRSNEVSKTQTLIGCLLNQMKIWWNPNFDLWMLHPINPILDC